MLDQHPDAEHERKVAKSKQHVAFGYLVMDRPWYRADSSDMHDHDSAHKRPKPPLPAVVPQHQANSQHHHDALTSRLRQGFSLELADPNCDQKPEYN